MKKTAGKLANNVFARLKPTQPGLFYVVATGFIRLDSAVQKAELRWSRRDHREADSDNQPSFADTSANITGTEAASAKSQSSMAVL